VDVRRLRIQEGDTVRGHTICGGIDERVVYVRITSDIVEGSTVDIVEM